MGPGRHTAWLCKVTAGAVVVAILSAAADAQVLRLDLNGTFEGQAGTQKILAEPGPGATFVDSADGQGVEPGEEGPAVIVPVPDELWRSTGTLSFWFRPSRTIRFTSGPEGRPRRMVLVECPVLRADLSEEPGLTMLRLGLPGGSSRSLMWSHLKGGQWYHLAFAWDAADGRLEVYLGGALQQELRPRGAERSWNLPASSSGPIRLGGTLGRGDAAAKFAVDSVALYSTFMHEKGLACTLKGRPVEPLRGEGRTKYSGALDLSPYKLKLIYEADFTRPLDVIAEDELFVGDRRAKLPTGKDWVLEGPGRAWTQSDRLHLESSKPQSGGHVVLWNTRVFPRDYLLEFGMSPKDSRNGLNIVFFSATSRQGGGIFDLGLPRRGGLFRNYHSGALDCYHISYWACSAAGGGTPRRTANVRKNFGFYLVACGNDRIAGQGQGPHRVRLLNTGGKIRLETRGQLAAAFDDDGATYGPVLGSGAIGLRQMAHTHRASYTHFKVWKIDPRGSADD